MLWLTLANQGGVREEQNVDQVNINVNIRTVQGGEREEQSVNHVNANVTLKRCREGRERSKMSTK